MAREGWEWKSPSMSARAFESRTQAGKRLAERLEAEHFENPVVLALPRGGVPVALEVARRLNAPLDVLLVRKIGLPGQPELALGAVVDGEDRSIVVNDDVLRATGFDSSDVARLAEPQIKEIERRRKLYFNNRVPASVSGATAIIVDDGVATGATVRAAIDALRKRKPRSIVLAFPVGPEEAILELQQAADKVICLETPPGFFSIGAHYADFRQVSDEDVIAMLEASAPARARV